MPLDLKGFKSLSMNIICLAAETIHDLIPSYQKLDTQTCFYT